MRYYEMARGDRGCHSPGKSVVFLILIFFLQVFGLAFSPAPADALTTIDVSDVSTTFPITVSGNEDFTITGAKTDLTITDTAISIASGYSGIVTLEDLDLVFGSDGHQSAMIIDGGIDNPIEIVGGVTLTGQSNTSGPVGHAIQFKGDDTMTLTLNLASGATLTATGGTAGGNNEGGGGFSHHGNATGAYPPGSLTLTGYGTCEFIAGVSASTDTDDHGGNAIHVKNLVISDGVSVESRGGNGTNNANGGNGVDCLALTMSGSATLKAYGGNSTDGAGGLGLLCNGSIALSGNAGILEARGGDGGVSGEGLPGIIAVSASLRNGTSIDVVSAGTGGDQWDDFWLEFAEINGDVNGTPVYKVSVHVSPPGTYNIAAAGFSSSNATTDANGDAQLWLPATGSAITVTATGAGTSAGLTGAAAAQATQTVYPLLSITASAPPSSPPDDPILPPDNPIVSPDNPIVSPDNPLPLPETPAAQEPAKPVEEAYVPAADGSVSVTIPVTDQGGQVMTVIDIPNTADNEQAKSKLADMGLTVEVLNGAVVINGEEATDIGTVTITVDVINAEGEVESTTVTFTVEPLPFEPSTTADTTPVNWTGTLEESARPDGAKEYQFTLLIPLYLPTEQVARVASEDVTILGGTHSAPPRVISPDYARSVRRAARGAGETAFMMVAGVTPDPQKVEITEIKYRVGIHQYEQKFPNSVKLTDTAVDDRTGQTSESGGGGCNSGAFGFVGLTLICAVARRTRAR